MPPKGAKTAPIHLAQLGLQAKVLPRRQWKPPVAPSASSAAPWAGVAKQILASLGALMRALEPIESHAGRMRLLAAAAALHDDADEASWFLLLSEEENGSRCARCGRARRISPRPERT